VVEKLNLFLDLLQSYKVSLAAPRSGTEPVRMTLVMVVPSGRSPGEREEPERQTDRQTHTGRDRTPLGDRSRWGKLPDCWSLRVSSWTPTFLPECSRGGSCVKGDSSRSWGPDSVAVFSQGF
jgi:hypothetical protein